jgi:hypothetical protein
MSDVVDPGVEAGAIADWKDSLPEDIRGEASLESIKDIGSLAKSYVSAQKMIGADKVVIPKDDAPPEEWRSVYQKLGMPENADGYEFKAQDDWGDTERANLKMFQDKAHELGLSKAQANKLLDWNLEMGGKQAELVRAAQTEKMNAAVTQLETDWGKKDSATWNDKYGAARAAEEHFAKDIPELKAALAETGAGDHPAVLRLFARLGEGLKEGGLKGGARMAPEDAKAAYSSKMADPDFQKRLFSTNRAERTAALDEQAKYLAAINGVDYQ